MRLKQNRVKTYYHKKAGIVHDSEGNSSIEYGSASEFRAEEWTAGGKIQEERFGIRLPNIRNIRIEGVYEEGQSNDGHFGYQIKDGPFFTVNDGVCLHVPPTSNPDYRIIAVYPYRFLTLEVEKI